MDNFSTPEKGNQIFPSPASLLNPNIYYNSLLNQNLSLNEQLMNQFQKNSNFNLPKTKSPKKTKINNQLEISLISLLNAISDYKTKNSSRNSNSITKKEISNKNESESSDSEKEGDSFAVMELLTQKRKQKYCNACPHHNAPHYAKGMCSNCYHSRGRKKKPWKCPHLNKFHYAHGLCQNCYQMKYMKKQNDEGLKPVHSCSNLDLEESSNSTNEMREKSESLHKKGKSKNNRHSNKNN